MIYGYLRETKEKALAAGLNENGVCRTGLEEYLQMIFPEINDWVHDKTLGNGSRKRPDYRSESLKLIIEFDGLPHYQKPDIILKDQENTKYYESLGYKVVRIPYFIQLTNEVVKKLFDRDVTTQLFDSNLPSLNISGYCTPAYLCPLGIERMAKELKQFPDQLKVNLKYLEDCDNEILTGIKYLKNFL